MVRHHVLVGLGFKKQHFRNRAIHYMLNRGSGFYVNHGSKRHTKIGENLREHQNCKSIYNSTKTSIQRKI